MYSKFFAGARGIQEAYQVFPQVQFKTNLLNTEGLFRTQRANSIP